MMNDMENPLGIVSKEKDGFKVVFERTLPHDIQTVWDAITNPEKLKIWFTDFDMEFKEGGKIKIIFRDAAKTITHGEIVSIQPPHKFVWTWEGELAVWELSPQGKNTKLTFTYSKMADQWAVDAAGGFHTILDRLQLALNGKKESYPFGTEEFDPAQIELRETYGKIIFETYPELAVHNPIRLQRVYHSPIATVWSAITDNAQLKKWYFDFSENFKLNVGHEFDWTAGPPEGKQWLHRGKIEEVITGKKLMHSWEYPGYQGKGMVIWELTEIDPSHTRLDFTFKILVPFDQNERDLKRSNFSEGWNHIIHTGLKEFLEK